MTYFLIFLDSSININNILAQRLLISRSHAQQNLLCEVTAVIEFVMQIPSLDRENMLEC